jgi:uncharacterized membrane protein YfcA
MGAGVVRDVLTLGLGVATGVLSAAFGVGGAVVSTPGIRALGASALTAVGTTLPSILPSAATGTARYAREGLIRWDVVAWVAPVGAIATVGGSLLSHVVPGNGHWLMILTAALLALTAYRMGTNEGAAETLSLSTSARQTGPELSTLHAVGIGLAGGLLSGLLGIGGGVVMVPGFSEVLKLPTKVAIGTSLACVGLLAIPGTITHALLHDIDWRFAAFLAIGVIPGARLGASLAIRSTDRRLRLSVAVFLGVIALIYGIGEIAALGS